MNQIAIYIHYLLFLLYKLTKIVLQLLLAILFQPLFSIIKIIGGLFPVKKYRDDSVDTKIAECQKQLDNYLKNTNSHTKYKIQWTKSDKAPNAHAASLGRIVLTGDWNILDKETIAIDGVRYKTIDYLYITIGHELGHKDSEPFVNFFSNIQNYIREVRADYVGIQFAEFCGIERQLAIDTKYHLSEYYDNYFDNRMDALSSYLDGHPTNANRRKYLEMSDVFCKKIVDEIVTDYYMEKAVAFTNTPLCDRIKKKAVIFNLFSKR